jgi:hypothetical protein
MRRSAGPNVALGLIGVLLSAWPQVVTAREIGGSLRWRDAAGRTGTVPVKGRVDDANLQAVVYLSSGRLIVRGQVDSAGRATGTFRRERLGPPVGSFFADLRQDGADGSFVIFAPLSGSGDIGTASEPSVEGPQGSGHWEME